MVGRLVLVQLIGVQIPVPEQVLTKSISYDMLFLYLNKYFVEL